MWETEIVNERVLASLVNGIFLLKKIFFRGKIFVKKKSMKIKRKTDKNEIESKQSNESSEYIELSITAFPRTEGV